MRYGLQLSILSMRFATFTSVRTLERRATLNSLYEILQGRGHEDVQNHALSILFMRFLVIFGTPDGEEAIYFQFSL